MKTTIVVALALSLLAAPVLARDVMYPVLPGTSLRDHSKPGRLIEGNNVYPTIPGTSLRDYGKPGYTVDRHDDGSTTFHPTLPGTSIRDYGKTDYFMK
ncbi:MAG: hypothetical protein AABY81_02400 [Pseudomonadota bacterium]